MRNESSCSRKTARLIPVLLITLIFCLFIGSAFAETEAGLRPKVTMEGTGALGTALS